MKQWNKFNQYLYKYQIKTLLFYNIIKMSKSNNYTFNITFNNIIRSTIRIKYSTVSI